MDSNDEAYTNIRGRQHEQEVTQSDIETRKSNFLENSRLASAQ